MWHHFVVFVSEAFSSDSSSKMHVFTHDSYSSSMKCTKVNVFKESNDISFSSFLKGMKRGSLETKIWVKSIGQMSNKSLEWKFLHKSSCWFLVSLDLSKGNSSRSPSSFLSFDNSSFSWSSLSSTFFASSTFLLGFLGLFCHGFSSSHLCFRVLVIFKI